MLCHNVYRQFCLPSSNWADMSSENCHVCSTLKHPKDPFLSRCGSTKTTLHLFEQWPCANTLQTIIIIHKSLKTVVYYVVQWTRAMKPISYQCLRHSTHLLHSLMCAKHGRTWVFVYKQWSFIRHAFPHHMRLQVHTPNNSDSMVIINRQLFYPASSIHNYSHIRTCRNVAGRSMHVRALTGIAV